MTSINCPKTWKDFTKTDIYRDIDEIDPHAFMRCMVKDKYYRTVLYWAEPTWAVFIENDEDYEDAQRESETRKLKGIIYLVQIGPNLFKFGRTTNMRKRINQYPRGSTIVKYENVDNMYTAEKVLLNCANESNGRLYNGNEFYYFEDQNEPLKVFDLALERIR